MLNIEILKENIGKLEKKINYVFKEKSNIILALSHSSYANEYKGANLKSNERLEFLGDAVLNIVISEHIYNNYPTLSEGEMTKARASIVCEPSLVKCSNNINIGNYLVLGKGEEHTGGRTRTSILSDAFEAVIGAIYIDGGFEHAKKFIHEQMMQIVVDTMKGINMMDYKTSLQEVIQKRGDNKITYEIIQEKGPDHNKIFISQVKISDKVMGTGEGRSKKEAEQNAAKAALCKIGDCDE